MWFPKRDNSDLGSARREIDVTIGKREDTRHDLKTKIGLTDIDTTEILNTASADADVSHANSRKTVPLSSPSFKESLSAFMEAAQEIQSTSAAESDGEDETVLLHEVERIHRRRMVHANSSNQRIDTRNDVGIESCVGRQSSKCTEEEEELEIIGYLKEASAERKLRQSQWKRRSPQHSLSLRNKRISSSPGKIKSPRHSVLTSRRGDPRHAFADEISKLRAAASVAKRREHKRSGSFERLADWISSVFSTKDSDNVSKSRRKGHVMATEQALDKMTISPRRNLDVSSVAECAYLRKAKYLSMHLLGSNSWSKIDSEIRSRFDPEHDKCYCPECLSAKAKRTGIEDSNLKRKGMPARNYSRPDGWCHIGLHVDQKTYAEGKDIWKKWNVAFHGFPQQHIASIIVNGVAFPNDKIRVGKRFVRVRKPLGHSRDKTALSNVFVSPSILCAGCPLVYAIPVRVEDEAGEKLWLQCALKLRIDPECFTTRGNNIDPRLYPLDLPFDENIPNSEIEWFTDARNCLVPTALMIRWSRKNPRAEMMDKISKWRMSQQPEKTSTSWFKFGKCAGVRKKKPDATVSSPSSSSSSFDVIDFKESGDIFFGVLRKRAEKQLEKVLKELKGMYKVSKVDGAKQDVFVNEICRILGSKVLKEVIDEVEDTTRSVEKSKVTNARISKAKDSSKEDRTSGSSALSPRSKRTLSRDIDEQPLKKQRSRRYRSTECPVISLRNEKPPTIRTLSPPTLSRKRSSTL